MALSNEESSSNERNVGGINSSILHVPDTSVMTVFDQLMSLVHEKEAIPPMKLELDAYLEEKILIFLIMETPLLVPWSGGGIIVSNIKILSKMARDILVALMSTVVSESTFNAGGREIDEYRSRLNEESIEALICLSLIHI